MDDRPPPPRRSVRRTRPGAAGVGGFALRAVGALLAGLGHAFAVLGAAIWRAWLRLSARTRVRAGLALALVALVSPVLVINLAVAYFGRTHVFPLSPYFLREKIIALGSYAIHQPLCWWRGHADMAELVARAEARQRLPRGLLAAIVKVESDGRPHRISSAGAMGPGQLMPDTARMLGVGDPFDSEANVDGAARLLADHLVRFRNKLPLAIAAYHAGPGAVRGRVPQNGETPGYVAKVLRVRAQLRGQRPSKVAVN